MANTSAPFDFRQAQGTDLAPTYEAAGPDSGLPKVLNTVEAARHLNRRPQTLRRWSCFDSGPIKPIRINGRLAWRVADLERLLTAGVA